MQLWSRSDNNFLRLSMAVSWISTYSISNWVHCSNSWRALWPWPLFLTLSSNFSGSLSSRPDDERSSFLRCRSFSQLKIGLNFKFFYSLINSHPTSWWLKTKTQNDSFRRTWQILSMLRSDRSGGILSALFRLYLSKIW